MRRFLKVATEMAEPTHSSEVVIKRSGTNVKRSWTCVGLDPRNDRLIPLIDLGEQDGSDAASIE